MRKKAGKPQQKKRAAQKSSAARASNKKIGTQNPKQAPGQAISVAAKATENFILKPIEGKKQLLHASITTAPAQGLHGRFLGDEWQTTRIDIFPQSNPDITGEITDLSMLKENSFDAIWLPRILDFYPWHAVVPALEQCLRVLKPDGYLFLATLDLERIGEKISNHGIERSLYQENGQDVCVIDLLFGHHTPVSEGRPVALPRTGFNSNTIAHKLQKAGFLNIRVKREEYLLWAAAHKAGKNNTGNTKPDIVGDDVNKMMQERDDLEKEPEIWRGWPPVYSDNNK